MLVDRYFSFLIFRALHGVGSASFLEPRGLHLEPDFHAVSTGPPASPDCWLKAVKALEYGTLLNSGVDASACTWMTPYHQKVLALEVTRCHLNDLGRPLVLDDESKCEFHAYEKSITDCLAHLSDAGVTAYTHFFSYVNQLCTRLLREVVVGQYYDTSAQLAKSSELAEGRLKELVKKQEDLWAFWSEREIELSTLHDQFRNKVEEQALQLQSELQSQQEKLMKTQRDRIHQQGIEMTNQALHLQKELQNQQEAWMKSQGSMQRNQTLEMELQRQELQRLTETVTKTHQSMKPWSNGLENIFTSIMAGYSLVRTILFAFGSCCTALFFTFPKRFRWMRWYLIGFILLEGFVEFFILVKNNGRSPSFQEMESCYTFRAVLVHLEVVMYLLGCISSCCCSFREDENDSGMISQQQPLEESYHDRQEKLLRQLESLEERWKTHLSKQEQVALTRCSEQPNTSLYHPPQLLARSGQQQEIETSKLVEFGLNSVASPSLPSQFPIWSVSPTPWDLSTFASQPLMSLPSPPQALQTHGEEDTENVLRAEEFDDGKEHESRNDYERDCERKRTSSEISVTYNDDEIEEPSSKRPKRILGTANL